MSIIIETTIGSLTIDLYTKERPRTCLNFLKLCKLKYYNFCSFHQIIKDFIVQSGRNTFNGRKNGESIYYFIYGEQGRYYESETIPKLKHEDIGTISMINTKDQLIGSEFFITLSKDLDYLDNKHTVFGQVVEGFEVLYKLNEILCDSKNKPYKDVLITHTIILDDPFDDPVGINFPENSPEPTEDLLTSTNIFLERDFDENYGKSNEEIEEEMKDKEAKSRAIILEMIGDLPNADVAPPDNVLFVCKLNPVTREEDLSVIFSRFGKILDCEIIRDPKTKESLQYAFIEFENAKDCEKAYFKMDNVLIDDKRIHVDFSQSVMKYKWKKKLEKNDKDKKNKIDDYNKRDKVRRYSRSRSREKHFLKSKDTKYNDHKEYKWKSYRRSRSNSIDKKKDKYNRKKSYDKYQVNQIREHRSSKMSSSRDRELSLSREKHISRHHERYINKRGSRNRRSSSNERYKKSNSKSHRNYEENFRR